jgi:Bacteriophage Mu Gam like protein
VESSEVAPKITSQAQAELVLAGMNHASLILAGVVALQKSKIAAAKCHDREIAEISARMNRDRASLEAWGKATRKLWGEDKSLKMSHGTIGFRMSNRSLGLLPGWCWEDVIKTLMRLRKKFGAYIREKFEVDRALILSHSRPERELLSEGTLKRLGLKVVQEECFFVELATIAPPAPNGVAAARVGQDLESKNQ